MAEELGCGINREKFDWFLTTVQDTFRFFEKYPTGISISQHHIPVTPNGHGNHKKFEDHILCEVGKLHP
jgi:hypothetical protein